MPSKEACAECTQNCFLMHKKQKIPSPLASTFCKVMFDDEYSNILFLPPKFAYCVRKKIGKSTFLEDSYGEKWEVKVKKIDGLLAFEEGWNTFCLAHGLNIGDLLVFHYIMESHFVVSMYGESGCPESRHFGFTNHKMKETRKEQKLTSVDQIPSNVNTNGHHHETPNVITTTNSHDHMVASSSRSQPSDSDKEKSQRSKPLVNTKSCDKTVCETPTNNSGHVEQLEGVDLGVNNVHDVSITEISPEKLSGSRKDDLAVVGGGGDETKGKESRKVLETSPKKMREKPYENTHKSSINKRLRNTMLRMTPAKSAKKEFVLTGQTDVSGSKLCNDGGAPGDFLKPIAKQMETAKKNRDSTGVIKTNSHKEENNNILQKVKPEPVDYEESPSVGPTNISFSAVMTSYQYLELPKWVKLKSKVILLRNNLELWPVLYQIKLGSKALTQTWEVFARKRGIETGDKCEFVLESEANSNFTCSVFTVNVSRK